MKRISVKTRILDPETVSSVELMALDCNVVDPHVRFSRRFRFRKFNPNPDLEGIPDPDLTPDIAKKLGQKEIDKNWPKFALLHPSRQCLFIKL